MGFNHTFKFKESWHSYGQAKSLSFFDILSHETNKYNFPNNVCEIELSDKELDESKINAELRYELRKKDRLKPQSFEDHYLGCRTEYAVAKYFNVKPNFIIYKNGGDSGADVYIKPFQNLPSFPVQVKGTPVTVKHQWKNPRSPHLLIYDYELEKINNWYYVLCTTEKNPFISDCKKIKIYGFINSAYFYKIKTPWEKSSNDHNLSNSWGVHFTKLQPIWKLPETYKEDFKKIANS